MRVSPEGNRSNGGNVTRNTLPATLYSLALGAAGIGALVLVTQPQSLWANAVPLVFFAALSFVLKRTGFHVAPEVTHSLVGIVDLAAVFIFGPILGAWVAASSGFVYLFLTAWRREHWTLRDLLEIPLFNAGLKVGMAYASTRVYEWLGGQFAPRDLTLPMLPAFLAAMLVWFAIDHIGWGLLEYLRGGTAAVVQFTRTIIYYSLLMELLPLPIAIVIAVVYSSSSAAVFLLMALGLVGTAIVIQRFADVSAHLVLRRNDLSVLNQFSQALSEAGFDTQKIVDLLCEDSRRLVPAEMCRIELFDFDRGPEGTSQLVLEATPQGTRRLAEVASHDGDESTPNRGQPGNSKESAPPSPLFRYLARQREPVRIDNLEKDSPLPQVYMDGQPAQSALLAPLWAGQDLVGAVSLFSTQPDAFRPIHARNLASMAGQAAVSLQNARLYAVERRRAAQLATVSEVSRQVAAVLDLDELFQQVVTRIRERFGYSNVHIFTVDAEAGYVDFRASTHPRGSAWRDQGVRLRIGLEGIVGWVAAVREPLLVDDVRQEPRFVTLDPDKTLKDDTRSELAVPLVVGSNAVGVLDVQSDQLAAFGEEDLFILKTLAAQVAIAIEEARIFNSQREEAWYLNVMLQVAQNLSATNDLDEALETVVRITPLLVGVARCAVLLYQAADQSFVPAKAYGFTSEQEAEFLRLRFPSDSPLALGKMWRDQAPVIVQNPEASPLIRTEIQQSLQLESLLLAPLMTRGEIVGAMLVDQGTRSRQFSRHEIEVIMGITNQAAVAIEGARLTRESEEKKRLDYELTLARQIQQSFLPDACPVLPGYQICSMWQTARQVSGDFYDFIPLAGGRWGVVIADVTDKGMAAALFMALSRTILRTMAIGKPTPHEAADRANDVILADAHSDMFVTVFFSALDPATGRLTYVNAGHNPPLLYRAATGQVTALKEHGIALGVIPNITLEDHEITLEPGDSLLMYTDGLTEAMNAQEEEFGDARLASLVAAHGRESADRLVDEIARAVAEYTGADAQFDDLTMVALKRVSEQPSDAADQGCTPPADVLPSPA